MGGAVLWVRHGSRGLKGFRPLLHAGTADLMRFSRARIWIWRVLISKFFRGRENLWARTLGPPFGNSGVRAHHSSPPEGWIMYPTTLGRQIHSFRKKVTVSLSFLLYYRVKKQWTVNIGLKITFSFPFVCRVHKCFLGMLFTQYQVFCAFELHGLLGFFLISSLWSSSAILPGHIFLPQLTPEIMIGW